MYHLVQAPYTCYERGHDTLQIIATKPIAAFGHEKTVRGANNVTVEMTNVFWCDF